MASDSLRTALLIGHDEAFFYVDEAARILRRSQSTIRYWILRGKLRTARIGHRVVVERDELIRFLGDVRDGTVER
jgi:excisionase family DNA binding protein